MKTMKGQLTFANLIYIFIGLYLYVVGLYPILETAITDRIIAMEANPQAWTDATVVILQLIPIAIPLGIIATIFIYATPRQVA